MLLYKQFWRIKRGEKTEAWRKRKDTRRIVRAGNIETIAIWTRVQREILMNDNYQKIKDTVNSIINISYTYIVSHKAIISNFPYCTNMALWRAYSSWVSLSRGVALYVHEYMREELRTESKLYVTKKRIKNVYSTTVLSILVYPLYYRILIRDIEITYNIIDG